MNEYAGMNDWSRLKAQYRTWLLWRSSNGSVYATRKRRLTQDAIDFGMAETVSGDSEEQLEKALKAQMELLRAFELGLL